MDEKRKMREEISFQYKWDIENLYKNIDDWNDNYNKVMPLAQDIVSYRGHIMDNSSNLLSVLIKTEKIERLLNNLMIYAYMKYHEDTANNDAIIIKGKIDKLVTDVNEMIFFVDTEVLKSDYKLVEQYIKENEDLKLYGFYFKDLFRNKEHILSDQEEKLMAGLREILNSPDDVYDTMLYTDFNYGSIKVDDKKIEISDTNFVKLLQSEDRNIRKKAFKKYYKLYQEFKNTMATVLKHNIKNTSFVAKTRKYNNALEMSLFFDNINPIVYDNLIKTVSDNLDIMYKYIDLRKKELGVDKLHMYDIYAKLVFGDTREYTYEEAKEIVIKALSIMGEDYVELLNKAFNERWIDVYPSKNKKSGAYSSGSYDSFPYILLNYNGTLNSVSTLAHELGHSIHSYYTNKNQPYIYAGYSIFAAEIASTVNEIILNYYLLKNTKDVKEKKIIMNELLEKFKGTIYRQTMFAEFEKILFEKVKGDEVLTENRISELYYQLNKKYYGPNIVHDKEISLEWARIPHFYRPFYVYQYATGMSAACAIASDILEGNQETLKKYKEFLASGSSDYPINLLKKVGIDMTTTTPIEKALKLFAETIDEYAMLTE